MRISARLTVVTVAALLAATPALALEKTSARVTDRSGQDVWNAAATCSVTYFNNCTGWLWVWSGFGDDQEVLGIVYDPCCSNASLETTNTYIWSGVLPGWGFTGTVEVSTADANGCPASLLAQKTFLPPEGLSVHTWGISVPGTVVLTMTGGNDWGLDPGVAIATDRPAGGPTGPVSHGFCYPSARETHSFYYGYRTTGLNCPGSPLFDGVGNAEWLNWSAAFSCAVGVESGMEYRSWGTIKSLYR